MRFSGLLLLLLFFTITNAAAQDKKLTRQFCNCLQNETGLDSLKLQSCFGKVVSKEFEKIEKEKARKDFLLKLDIDLQKSCPEYLRILQAVQPIKGDWVKLEKNLPTRLNQGICQELSKYKKLYYLEGSGDTTTVTLENGVWVEQLTNKKYYSRLNFEFTGNCEFVLTFIDSNDPIKEKMSFKGEKYQYRIIDKTSNYYVVTVSSKVVVYQFRLYFE